MPCPDLGALVAAVVLTVLIATPGGRAAAAGFLAQFRSECFQVISLNSSQSMQLDAVMSQLVQTGVFTGDRGKLDSMAKPAPARDPAGGVTVFLNSHLLTEVEVVCDRVAIVNQGRVVASGPLDELAGAVTQLRLLLDRVDADLLALVGRYGEVARVEGTAVTLDVDALEVGADLAGVLVGSGYRLYGLVPVQRSLEDVFVDLVGEVRER